MACAWRGSRPREIEAAHIAIGLADRHHGGQERLHCGLARAPRKGNGTTVVQAANLEALGEGAPVLHERRVAKHAPQQDEAAHVQKAHLQVAQPHAALVEQVLKRALKALQILLARLLFGQHLGHFRVLALAAARPLGRAVIGRVEGGRFGGEHRVEGGCGRVRRGE
jgi:hypothetical protein